MSIRDAHATPMVPRHLRPLQVLVRATSVVLIGLAGWTLVEFYRETFGGRGDDGVALSAGPGAPSLEELVRQLQGDGSWSLGGPVDWRIEPLALGTAEAGDRLRRLGTPLPADRSPTTLETELFAWLRRSGAVVTMVEGLRVYEMRLTGGLVRVVAEVDGLRMRLAQVVWGGPGVRGQLIEVTPAPAEASAGAPGVSWPPPPAGASVLARRWDGDQLTAELIGPVSDPASLPVAWEPAGWSRRSTGGPAEAAATIVRGPRDMLSVWRFGPVGAEYLLLIRCPVETPAP